MRSVAVALLLLVIGACAVSAPKLRAPVQGELVSREGDACYVLELHRGGAASQRRVVCPP